jgi:hypothetical protein
MSKVLNVNGNYIVRVQPGGNIILDTLGGVPGSYGLVTIFGSLDVQGTLTFIESTNTQISDNILQLNQGQTGNGISSANNYVSGLEIKRGNYSAAQILFNENVQHYDPVTSTEVSGTFVLSTADGILSGLRVASISNSGTTDFVFDMQGSVNVLRVANSLGGYENNINNDNDIINRKYLYNYVAASNGVASVDRIYFPTTGGIAGSTSSIEAFGSSIVFQISQSTRAIISPTGVSVDNINLYSNTITNTTSNNLILSSTNNNVEINSVLNLDNQSSIPSYTTGTTKIYSSATAGPGGTGIYFTNNQAAHTADELVSRRRAVALSILL